MNQTKFAFAMMFILAMAAGGAIGLITARSLTGASAPGPVVEGDVPPSPGPRQSRDRRAWLAEELSLTPEQQMKMEEIWSGLARGGGREQFEQFRNLVRQRDDAIIALFTPEQKAEYERLMGDYDAKFEAHNAERDRAFQQAVDQTKAILTDEQRQRYEELMSRRKMDRPDKDKGDRPERPPFGMPSPGGNGRGGKHKSSTQMEP